MSREEVARRITDRGGEVEGRREEMRPGRNKESKGQNMKGGEGKKC